MNLDASSSTPGTGASAIRTYVWSLGDGSTASGRTVTKTFAATGTFNVTLTVTNDRGLAASTTQAVSVGTTTGPTAAFTFSPTTPVVNQAVNFNAIASSAAPGRSIDSYTWNFGDGSATKTGPTAQHDFGTAGTYGVTLTVTDDTGQRTTVTQSVIVAPGAGGGTPVPPTATFVFSPTSPQVNQSVNFNAEASRPGAGRTIVSYGWNFGDTGTATGTTPAHSFTTVGTYNVTLVVIDDIGQRSTFVQPVIVSAGGGGGGATVAAFTFSPLAPSALQPVFFNASGSSTTTGHTLTTYLWNFGDGTLVTGNTFSVTHTFTAAGTFSVTLIVEDEIGQTGRTTTPVVVTAAGAGSLTAEFTISPLDPRSGQLVTFNANLSAPVGSITAYDWDFGDGLILNGLASFITSHTYFTLTGNDFTVRLTVHDNTGRVATTTKVLKVISGNDPVASFTVSQSPTTVGTAVTFDGGASVPIAPKTIVRYTWDYGDGSAIVSTAPGSSTSHSYSSVGTFVVRLTVTDSEGLTASTTRTLQVQ
ncbi:MAG: PKD domain-containing protein [Acidobacteriota bacterium]